MRIESYTSFGYTAEKGKKGKKWVSMFAISILSPPFSSFFFFCVSLSSTIGDTWRDTGRRTRRRTRFSALQRGHLVYLSFFLGRICIEREKCVESVSRSKRCPLNDMNSISTALFLSSSTSMYTFRRILLSLSLSLSLCPCVCVCECMYVCFAYLRRVAAALLPAIHGTWVEAGIASVRHVHTSHFQDTHTKGKG